MLPERSFTGMLQDRFDNQTRADIDAARIAIARARLDRAEQMVMLRRLELASVPCGSEDEKGLRDLVHMCERAAFNRRLELDMLMRTRRRRDGDQRP